MPILKTKLHRYSVERGSDEAKEIDALREATQGDGAGRPMVCIGRTDYPSKFPHIVEEVDIDTKCLFDNQWNESGPGARRLFDYYEESHHNPKYKTTRYGHWLEITEEMRQVRKQVTKCGYCGKHYDTPTASGFCGGCIGSEHLDEKDLHLLRLKPAGSSFGAKREELTNVEKASLLPIYRREQGLGKEARAAKKLKGLRLQVSKIVPEAEAKAAKDIADSKIEQEGKNWLLDNNYRAIDNVIFYSHTQRWAFGWRNTLSEEEKSELETLLCEFPFDYDIKTRGV